MNTQTRQPVIDRINQRLLSISVDQFTHVTDTIFNLLNIPQVSYTEHTPSRQDIDIQNIRVNKHYIEKMVDISLLERYAIDSYLDHVNETLDKLAKENAKYLSSISQDLLKQAILFPTIQMLRDDQFPIPPMSDTPIDDPTHIYTTITLRNLPCFTLINHFDDNSNILDTTYLIIAPGRKETYVKINETKQELVFLLDNQINDLSRQTDVDIFIHELNKIIKEIFTYLNTSYQYRKNSLSLKTNQE